MRNLSFIFIILFVSAPFCVAQTKPKPKPTPQAIPAVVPIKPGDSLEARGGSVEGRTYRNEKFYFEITLPETWYIAGADFASIMRNKGVDLSVKAPTNIPPRSREKLNQAIKDVDILLTAFRDDSVAKDGAVLRISSEDLKAEPQIKDAIDYFDAIRLTYKSITLPPDFKYSETQAEQLGPMQFGFLDTSSKAGKKRMYATVRNGYAIMFTLSYSKLDDLQSFRQILETGTFH